MTAVNLQRLIDLVDTKLKAVDEACGPQPEDYDGRSAWWASRDALLKGVQGELTAQEGARFSYVPAHDHRLVMAEIRTSSTSGWIGALRNWQVAARKRIAKAAA